MATDPAGCTVLEEANQDCGHMIVDAHGEIQHHEIPDDEAPHAPDSSCGCGPQRYTVGGEVVYEHVDQDRE